jgi:hypothetical protein
MAASLPATAQTTKPMPVRTVTDTTCMNTPGIPGDSSGTQHMRKDSTGMRHQGGRKNCLDRVHTSMLSDSLCETTAADSIAYNRADSIAMNTDAMAGRKHRPTMRSNCKMGLGAGIGTDSSLYQIRPDSTMPRKP